MTAAAKDGPGNHAAGTAGEARRAAETAPHGDVDRWAGFSLEKTRKTAAEPAAPEGAEKPRAGLPKDA